VKIANHVFVVTGGAAGIGRELVKGILNRGGRVAMVDFNEQALLDSYESLSSAEQENCSVHRVDVSDKDTVAALPERVIEKHGAVDGLINNAGIIQPFVRVNDLDYDSIDRVMRVNFYGTLYMIKSFLPHFLKRSEAHIVNISSMGGFLPVPGQSVYGASKAAVKLLTEGLYMELQETRVRVTAVFPGAVDTNIAENSGVNLEGDPDDGKEYSRLSAHDAADQILEALERDKIRVFVGRDSKSMNLIYRLNPKWAIALIAKQMKGLLPPIQ